MSRTPYLRTITLAGGFVAVGLIATPIAEAAKSVFEFQGTVRNAEDNSFGIEVGDILNATAIFDPNDITGGPRDEIPLSAPGDLTFSIRPSGGTNTILFDGSDCSRGRCPASIVFEQGQFEGIGYGNGTQTTPDNIGLQTFSNFAFERNFAGTVFASGGPFLPTQASPS